MRDGLTSTSSALTDRSCPALRASRQRLPISPLAAADVGAEQRPFRVGRSRSLTSTALVASLFLVGGANAPHGGSKSSSLRPAGPSHALLTLSLRSPVPAKSRLSRLSSPPPSGRLPRATRKPVLAAPPLRYGPFGFGQAPRLPSRDAIARGTDPRRSKGRTPWRPSAS